MKNFLSLIWVKQFILWLISPSAQLTEIGARWQAELLAGLTFLFACFNIIGLLAAWRFGNAMGSLIFVTLTAISSIAYVLSRSRYYRVGVWILLSGLTLSTFLYMSSGQTTNGPQFALLLFTPLIFVLSTAFLSVWELAVLLGVITFSILIAPWWIPEMANRSYGSTLGALITLGILTLATQQYRNTIERERLIEHQKDEEATQQHTREVNALNDIGQAIAMVEDLERTLEKILQALKSALPLDVFYVALYDGQHNTISYPLYYDSGRKWAEPPTPLYEKSSAAQAIASRQPFLFNRTPEEIRSLQDSPNNAQYIARLGDRSKISVSFIVAPLLIGDTVIGAISAHSYSYNAYNAEHLALLTGASYQVAIAIENARLYDALRNELSEREQAEQKVRHSAEEMYLLYQMGIALTSGQDLYHALRALVQELKRLMIVDAFHVGLHDSQTDLLTYPLFLNLEKDLEIAPRKLSDNPGLTGEVITTRQTIYLPDISDPEVQRIHNIVIIIDIGIRSYLGIPLLLQDRVIGIMSVQALQPDAYNQDQIRLLETLASQVVIIIEKSRLLEQVQQELVERQRTEKQLQLSLQEKEVLLKEIHHRVKNNMQVIVSMMSLQSAYITDPQLLDIFTDSQNRVRSMALVHEKLYKSANLAQIDFHDYLQHLASTLFHSYSPRVSNINLTFDIGEIALGVDAAIPCGLIVNELISNTLKHAFPNNRAGKVHISLQVIETGGLELSVADDGVGIPVEKNWRKTDSLGMQLVQSLVKQINGTIEMMRLNPGTRFTISFIQPK